MQRKKRALTLLETLIALSLTSLILSFLFSFLVETSRTEKKLEEARAKVTQRGYFQMRMQSLLSSIDKNSLDPFFYTTLLESSSQPVLEVLFDHGIDPDPLFCGVLRGEIYLDEKNNLTLLFKPLNPNHGGTERKEILFPKIRRFEMEFLGNTLASEKGSFRPVSTTVGWNQKWPKSNRQLPSIVRAYVYEEGEEDPLCYAFILPLIEPMIAYEEKRR